MADAPKLPKLEMKMIALPVLLMVTRKIDFKDPNIVKMSQIAFVSVAILMLTLHYFVYTRALGNANKSKKIYVPPKPKPQLPFGLGGAEEPTLATDYKDTTLGEHEVALIKESAQSIILSVAMSMFFSLKFDVHVSLVMQAVMLPLNALDSIVLKKYLLGTDKNVDGGNNLYNEEDVMPTKEILDARHAAKTAAAAAAAAPIENTPPSDADAKKNE